MVVEPESYFILDKPVVQGDTGTITLVFEDDAVPPQAVDITLWDFYYTAKINVNDDDSDAMIKLEPGDVVKTDSGAGGGNPDTATFTLPAADTAAMTSGTYYQDIQVIKDSGRVYTIVKGSLVIEDQVTQRIV